MSVLPTRISSHTSPPLITHTKPHRALEQGTAAIVHLSATTTDMLAHLRHISATVGSFQSHFSRWSDNAESDRLEVRLARQRQLLAAASRLGLTVMLVGVAWGALRYGRVWEVHAVCQTGGLGGRAGGGGWWAASRFVPGARGVASFWSYGLCCIENMGEFRGLVILTGGLGISWCGLPCQLQSQSPATQSQSNHSTPTPNPNPNNPQACTHWASSSSGTS